MRMKLLRIYQTLTHAIEWMAIHLKYHQPSNVITGNRWTWCQQPVLDARGSTDFSQKLAA